ncbi:MAG: flavin reductase family protein [Promethearchaeota archaeon]|nr:MAG: flavin reductase family protein [Candidatus Lokiarchaeota archaeon]
MAKIKVKIHPYLIPKPVVLIGAMVNGKPNFFTVADVSTTGYKIPRFVVSSGKGHYTNSGIIENECFSVNIPSIDMVKETDYCGIKSGRRVDKSEVFDIIYSEELRNVPMIKEAPISHACKLVKNIDFGDTHYLFIGEIKETYLKEDCMMENIPDMNKIRPFVYNYDNWYWKIGESLAQAYKVGKEFTKKK